MLQVMMTMAAGALGTLQVGSTSFAAGGAIPGRFTCAGADLPPELHWSAPPTGTRSFALLVEDPDAPGGAFVHWVLYGIPAGTRSLDEGGAAAGRSGGNDFGRDGYGGPCPPPGAPHHYHFKVFALDRELTLPAGASAADLRRAMRGHVLAEGTLIGTFGR
ncbi:MAG TPA: YbhB/YbcL family Raf kinase inhibitor-like protein [Myxococcales bacterium]|nr:YbhB/YbcL family Raf kinase inhibitor-like protein [Myxococcales bacterium]